MYLPDFDYHAPHSLEEALGLLDSIGPGASLLAGGTDLLHKMKAGKHEPKALVSLRNVESLRTVRRDPSGSILIGSAVTHNGLIESPVLRDRWFSVPDAAHQMASNQIRNLGTVGGNIVNAAPSADLPPILIALGATVTLLSSSGSRELPLEDFFTEPATSVIRHGEILTEISIPDHPFTGSRYVKFGLRRSGALAVVGAAAAVAVDNGIIREVRIAMASSAPKPVRAYNAENFLKGKKASADALEEAARLVREEVRPRDSIRGSAEYRRHLAGTLARRALAASIDSGHGN